MYFYFIYLFIIMLLSGRYCLYPSQKKIDSRIRLRIVIILIIIISSLRFNIGFDWNQYLAYVYPVYNPVNVVRLELFNKLICWIAGTLYMPLVLFATYAVVTYSLLENVIEKFSDSKYESLMLYFCLFYLISLSTIRQAVAVAVIFYGFRYIREKNIFKYLLTCGFAFLFHKSAIIAVPIYVIYYIKQRYIFILYFISIVFFKVVLPKILVNIFPIFMIYLEKGGIGNSSGNLERLIHLLLVLYCFVFGKRNDKSVKGLMNICLIGILFPFVLGGHTGGRLAEYYLIYFILLIPKVNKRFKIEYKVLFLIPFYAYFFMYLYVTVSSSHSNEYVPFRWYFMESLNQNLK